MRFGPSAGDARERPPRYLVFSEGRRKWISTDRIGDPGFRGMSVVNHAVGDKPASITSSASRRAWHCTTSRIFRHDSARCSAPSTSMLAPSRTTAPKDTLGVVTVADYPYPRATSHAVFSFSLLQPERSELKVTADTVGCDIRKRRRLSKKRQKKQTLSSQKIQQPAPPPPD